MIVSSVAPHEHAEAAHDVRDSKAETACVKFDGRVDVRHAEYDMVDLLRAGALVPLSVAIPARHSGEIVLILSGYDPERFSREHPKTDANAGVIAAVNCAVRIEAHGAIALKIARHRF